MKAYKVISPFAAKTGDEIGLSDSEGKRLEEAKCVVEIEDRMVRPAQNRKRGRKKSLKETNSHIKDPKKRKEMFELNTKTSTDIEE